MLKPKNRKDWGCTIMIPAHSMQENQLHWRYTILDFTPLAALALTINCQAVIKKYYLC